MKRQAPAIAKQLGAKLYNKKASGALVDVEAKQPNPPIELLELRALLLGARPPSLINGKANPEYHRWWRKTNPERWAAMHRKSQKKYEKTTLHERNVIANKDEVRCLECTRLFKRDDALARGFRFLKCGSNRVICDECA